VVSNDGEPPAVPPRREARPLLIHALVDTAVAFLASVIVLLILGVSFWVVVIVALVLGIVAAPLTRRAEIRALTERESN
jgi:hypothetical protein